MITKTIWDTLKIKLDRLDRFIKIEVPGKRTNDIDISLSDILEHLELMSLYNKEKSTVKRIIMAYLEDVHNIHAEDGESYHWEQTHVSNEEMLDVVVEKNRIVTSDEILYECSIRYPELKLKYIDINQNPLLSAVGLKGFVPTAERYRYFSSIGDCAFNILKDCAEPLSLTNLFDAILESGCVTTENSLRSLLSRKDENRFIRFENDYWGLRENVYDLSDRRPAKSVTKKDFNTHMRELECFVSVNQRMPSMTVDESETSISRWIRNIQNGIIHISDFEMKTLNDFLESNKRLPQNQNELRFKQNCAEYKKVVTFLGKRPSNESRPQLCLWFSNNLYKDKMSENNKLWFDELLNWLAEQGVFYG